MVLYKDSISFQVEIKLLNLLVYLLSAFAELRETTISLAYPSVRMDQFGCRLTYLRIILYLRTFLENQARKFRFD